tara:strand:- start:482 stop:1789 length:1308 start_codon:yes stop_codon:yes gene_type:complete
MYINEIYKRVIKNFKLLGSGKILGGISSALTIFIVAREIGVKNFGILSIAISFVEICNILLSLRVWEATIKFLGDHKNNTTIRSDILCWSLKLSLKTSIIACVTICSFSYFFIDYIFNFEINLLNLILIYSFLCILVTTNETIDSFFRSSDSYKYILINNSLSNLIRFVIVLIILQFTDRMELIILGMGSSIFVGFLIRIKFLIELFTKLSYSFKFKNIKSFGPKRDFLKFAISTHLASIINLANEKNLGVLLIGYIAGPFYSGLFKAARSIAKLLRRIMDPILEIAYPEFVILVKEKKLADLQKLIFNSTKILGIASLTIGSIILLFSKNIISIFFGVDYLDASSALVLLIIAGLINNLSYWITPAILSFNKPRVLLIMSFFISILYILILYPLITEFQHVGAASAGIVRSMLVLTIGTLIYKNISKKESSTLV